MLLPLLLLGGGAALALEPPTVFPPPDEAAESALLEASNRARAGFGLAPLAPDEGLARAARGHSAEMAAVGFFSHSSPSAETANLTLRLARAGAPAVTAGENLSLIRGRADIAEAAVRGWLESPSHREALLSATYTHVGFGVAAGSSGETFVTQVLARQPRALRRSELIERRRDGFDLLVELEVAAPQTVLPRLAGWTGSATELAAGRQELVLHARSGEEQQLLVAAASGQPGNYVIQDGGWITPSTGSWQRDPSMPRLGLRVAGVRSRPASGRVAQLELQYEPAGAPLAVFVDGRHHRDAEISPGLLRLELPVGESASIQVGEVSGSSVRPFHAFTVLAGPGAPSLVAGEVR